MYIDLYYLIIDEGQYVCQKMYFCKMASKNFQFKQFIVSHEHCAMKVGTDGVLLGAWANVDQAARLLDLGTGSGLIALMLAQRSNGSIDAIDIDEGACRQARSNVENSPFRKRIQVIHSSLQAFTPNKRYDRIVCNPPFFSRSLKSPDVGRTVARHNESLPFEVLLARSASLLLPDGILSVIIPFDAYEEFHATAIRNGLHPTRKTTVRPMPQKPPKRLLLEYSPSTDDEKKSTDSELVVELERHVYSNEYIQLTKEFYLKNYE